MGKWLALALGTALAASAAWGATTVCVSVNDAGQPANDETCTPAVNADGRLVAFMSSATNLVAGDTNGVSDVFVRDRLSGATERVSVSSAGADQGDGASDHPALSADGRYVAFRSLATNLVAGDTNDKADVFVHDRLTRLTERMSVGAGGAQGNGDAALPALSADGRYAAFESAATNLVDGDTNGIVDVFVRDRWAGATERMNVSSAEEQATGGLPGVLAPAISANGRYVAFQSESGNLVPGDVNNNWDVFVRDRVAGTTERASVNNAGQEAGGDSGTPSISADGRLVMFSSTGALLVAGDTNGAQDVFVRDRATHATERVSLGNGGVQANGPSMSCYWTGPVISSDGRFVTFASQASNLVAGDTNAASDIFVRDRVDGTTERVSVSESGQQADGPSCEPTISADRRFVAFRSQATNLVEGITSGYSQVYVRDFTPETVPPETVITSGPCGQAISSDSATICWSGSDNETLPEGLRYSWRLDAGEWQAYAAHTCRELTGLSSGAHLLEVKARDQAENEDPTPAQCSFTVDLSGPAVEITEPAAGATVSRIVSIAATATHLSGIVRVEFSIDTSLQCTDYSAPFTCEWDTTPLSVPDGEAGICAKAYANDGKVSSACVQVTLDNTTFEDVLKTDPFWPYVEGLAREGITNGCVLNPPFFCPYATVNRAQMAKFLCIAAGKGPLDSATPTFADVPKGAWFYGWVERLADAASWPGGVPPTGGCRVVGATRYYCPFDAVTREQMAKLICTAAGRAPMPSCSGKFADVNAGSWACPYIERLADGPSWPGGVPVTSGCVCPGGYPGGAKCYCPKATSARYQMAAFIVRAFGIEL